MFPSRLKKLEAAMASATSYEEWRAAAIEHDDPPVVIAGFGDFGQTVGRLLDLFGLDWAPTQRWGEDLGPREP